MPLPEPLPLVIASGTERMVYLVASKSRPGARHRVDLLANKGACECDCKSWACRNWPAIRDGKPAGTKETLCRHGILARRHFLNLLLQTLAKEENE